MDKSFFDQIHNRVNTRSVKWDTHHLNQIHPQAIPMWVADMDFKTLPAITQALQKEVETGIYGYSFESEMYFNSVLSWLERRHQTQIQKEWVMSTPGVVSALNACILALTQENDGILIQEPVYYPFKRSIVTNHRQAIINPLQLIEGHYEIDFDDFEQKIIDHHVKLFILCSPHNPVGKVFSEDELNRLVDICKHYKVIIVSDEIHMDFVFKPHHHHVLIKLRPDYADSIITLMAASKTFNLAGFKVSQLISQNVDYLNRIKAVYSSLGLHGQNSLGLLASEIAYSQGDDYVDTLVDYLADSVKWIQDFLTRELPEVKLVQPEGLYLLWLDFRELHKDQTELKRFLSEEAKLWFNDGAMFGKGGEGFMRCNIALPHAKLEEAFKQLKQALK